MHLSKEEIESEKKAEVIMYYNSTKAGVDTLDQLIHVYSTKQITHRWSKAIFYNMVDVSALNALIVLIFRNQGAFRGATTVDQTTVHQTTVNQTTIDRNDICLKRP